MAQSSFGATVSLGGTALAEVVSISPPSQTSEVIDATNHDSSSGFREYVASLKDAGEVTVTMHYVAGSTSDDACIASIGTSTAVVIVAKAASGTEDISFSAIGTSYAVDALEIDNMQTATLTMKVTGELAQAPTA